MEITAANELDVVWHNPAIAAEHAPALRQLLTRAQRHLSAGARQAWVEQENRLKQRRARVSRGSPLGRKGRLSAMVSCGCAAG